MGYCYFYQFYLLVKHIIFDAVTSLSKGDNLSSAFNDNWAFPDIAYQMIVPGEKTGQLGLMMEKVAEYFGNDPRIEIVSISVDANRKAWETKLEKDKPEWKQFLLKNFCDLYNINGIPRFMMFDKKGRIITVDAPRPADPEIIGFIESHLK